MKRILTVILGTVIALTLTNTGVYAHHTDSGHCEENYDCEEDINCGTDVYEEHCEDDPWHCVSHKSGAYGCAQYVNITLYDGAEVYYTTDGTKPTQDSELYTMPIYITENTVLRTAAYVDGKRVESTKANIRIRTATPTASALEGEYKDSVSVRLSCAAKGADIYYTTDGSSPTSKSKKYVKPLKIEEDTTLKFIAYSENRLKSAVATRKYTITTNVYSDAKRQKLFELVNETRAEYGLAPLEELSLLSEIAQQRAKESSAYFSHWRADGTKWDSLLAANGLKTDRRAENLAYYYTTAKQALDSWLNDYSHRKNILDPNMKYIGIGYYNNGYCGYWSQLFIG